MENCVEPRPRVPPGFGRLLVCFGISSVGNGLVVPFTAVYVWQQLALGLGAVAWFYGVMAVVGLVVTPVAGRMVDDLGAGRLAATGLVLLAAGYGFLGLGPAYLVVPVAAVIIGSGSGFFNAAIVPCIAQVVTEADRRRAFSLRYLALNLGSGVGALVGVAILGLVEGRAGYSILFVLNALTFLPLIAVMLTVPAARQPATPADGGGGGGERSYARLLRVPELRLLLGYELLVVLFAYAQFETGVPLLLASYMGVQPWLFGLLVTANTVTVVACQLPVTRLLARSGEGAGLLFASGLWVAAYGACLASVWLPASTRPVTVAAFGVLFGLGETAYAASFEPLVVRLAPPEMVGRAAALMAVAGNLGGVAAPVLGVTIAAQAGASQGWLVYLIAIALTSVIAMRAHSKSR